MITKSQREAKNDAKEYDPKKYQKTAKGNFWQYAFIGKTSIEKLHRHLGIVPE